MICSLCNGLGTTICVSCGGTGTAFGQVCWKCHGTRRETCARCAGKRQTPEPAGQPVSPEHGHTFGVGHGKVYRSPTRPSEAFCVLGTPAAFYYCPRYNAGKSEQRPQDWVWMGLIRDLPYVEWTPVSNDGSVIPATFFRGTGGQLQAAWT